MSQVRLSGRLVCRDAEEAAIVRVYLPLHLDLTRVELGCLSFQVRPTVDPLVWTVDELFADEAAFRAHQARVAVSEWGRATAEIERSYVIEGASGYR